MEQPSPSAPDRRYTVQEYLTLEEASVVKHEYRRGRIVAMAGGTHAHALVAMNLGGELRSRLRDTPCIVTGSDVRVRVSATASYCYPDLSVVCAESVFDPPDRSVTLLNPQVVVEVLSPSTAESDIGGKFDDYMRIDSLQEYVLVAQNRPWARSFHRGPDGLWAIGPLVEGLQATLAFRSLGIDVPLAEVYAKVRLPPPAGGGPE